MTTRLLNSQQQSPTFWEHNWWETICSKDIDFVTLGKTKKKKFSPWSKNNFIDVHQNLEMVTWIECQDICSPYWCVCFRNDLLGSPVPLRLNTLSDRVLQIPADMEPDRAVANVGQVFLMDSTHLHFSDIFPVWNPGTNCPAHRHTVRTCSNRSSWTETINHPFCSSCHLSRTFVQRYLTLFCTAQQPEVSLLCFSPSVL